MLSAEGGTSGPPTSHMIVVARSKSINGPWENAPNNPIIHTYNAKRNGGTKVMVRLLTYLTVRGGFFIMLMRTNISAWGGKTLLEPVYITPDGWINAPTGAEIDKPIKSPMGSIKKPGWKDKLNEFRIGYEWRFYKSYDSTRTSFNNGVLTMKAQGKSLQESAPLLFISGDHSYEFSVEIEKDENSVAGLTLFYNEAFYVGTGFDSQNRIRWRKGAEKGRFKHEAGNHLWLKIRSDKQIVTGYFSYDGKNWVKRTGGWI